MQIISDEHVVVEHCGSAGIIRLNRARAINSLTIGMVRAISSTLDAFEDDPTVATAIILGEGDRGFCAGGDIRALYESGRGDPRRANILAGGICANPSYRVTRNRISHSWTASRWVVASEFRPMGGTG